MPVARPFIPQPIPRSSDAFFSAQASRLIGQPALRASMTVTDRTGGVARASIQVRNVTGEVCTGVYRVHVFAAASLGGAVLDQTDAVTNASGVAVVDLTTGAGPVLIHVSVLGVYDVLEGTVT